MQLNGASDLSDIGAINIAPKPSSVSNVKSCQSQGKPVQVMWIASMLMCQLNAVSRSAVHLNTAPFFL